MYLGNFPMLIFSRLLKNAHLLRFPHPSPCQARGGLGAAYIKVRFTSQDFGSPRERDFAKLNLHLDIFERPENSYFFNIVVYFHFFSGGEYARR